MEIENRVEMSHSMKMGIISDVCLGVEKKNFKEIHQFNTFYPKIISPKGRSHEM